MTPVQDGAEDKQDKKHKKKEKKEKEGKEKNKKDKSEKKDKKEKEHRRDEETELAGDGPDPDEAAKHSTEDSASKGTPHSEATEGVVVPAPDRKFKVEVVAVEGEGASKGNVNVTPALMHAHTPFSVLFERWCKQHNEQVENVVFEYEGKIIEADDTLLSLACLMDPEIPVSVGCYSRVDQPDCEDLLGAVFCKHDWEGDLWNCIAMYDDYKELVVKTMQGDTISFKDKGVLSQEPRKDQFPLRIFRMKIGEVPNSATEAKQDQGLPGTKTEQDPGKESAQDMDAKLNAEKDDLLGSKASGSADQEKEKQDTDIAAVEAHLASVALNRATTSDLEVLANAPKAPAQAVQTPAPEAPTPAQAGQPAQTAPAPTPAQPAETPVPEDEDHKPLSEEQLKRRQRQLTRFWRSVKCTGLIYLGL